MHDPDNCKQFLDASENLNSKFLKLSFKHQQCLISIYSIYTGNCILWRLSSRKRHYIIIKESQIRQAVTVPSSHREGAQTFTQRIIWSSLLFFLIRQSDPGSWRKMKCLTLQKKVNIYKIVDNILGNWHTLTGCLIMLILCGKDSTKCRKHCSEALVHVAKHP